MTAPDETPREPNVMPVGGEPGGGTMRVPDAAQHTPGPWQAKTAADWMRILILGPDGEWIAKVEPKLANANLITAAPDLLAACEEAAAWLEVVGRSNVTQALASKCRMAAAKARGNQ